MAVRHWTGMTIFLWICLHFSFPTTNFGTTPIEAFPNLKLLFVMFYTYLVYTHPESVLKDYTL